jgi:hypothetical protein
MVRQALHEECDPTAGKLQQSNIRPELVEERMKDVRIQEVFEYEKI